MSRAGLALLLALAACAPKPAGETARATPVPAGTPLPPMPYLAASKMEGSLFVLDRGNLQQSFKVLSPTGEAPAAPPFVVADAARRAFYVANFGGALARIGADAPGDPGRIAVTGALGDMSLSPDGKLLAANGASDRNVLLVDIAGWKIASSVALSTKPAPDGSGAGHPVWLKDASALLTEENAGGEAVLVSRDGKIKARRAVGGPIHTFLLAGTEALALVENGSVAVLSLPALEIVRTVKIPLAAGEPARLHHGTVSKDGTIAVVANMGSLRTDASGPTTVAAIRIATGEVLWNVTVSRNAGHLAWLDDKRLVVVGHRASALVILDGATGETLETWEILGAGPLGHGLDVSADGTVTFVDSTIGVLLRYKAGDRIGESDRLAEGLLTTLPE